jgi:hypothetical protein
MGRECGTYREEEKCIQGFEGGNLRERDHLESLHVDGTIILKWIFKKWKGRALTGLILLRIGTGDGRL